MDPDTTELGSPSPRKAFSHGFASLYNLYAKGTKPKIRQVISNVCAMLDTGLWMLETRVEHQVLSIEYQVWMREKISLLPP